MRSVIFERVQFRRALHEAELGDSGNRPCKEIEKVPHGRVVAAAACAGQSGDCRRTDGVCRNWGVGRVAADCLRDGCWKSRAACFEGE